MEKEKLTEKAEAYMSTMYGEDFKEVKKYWFCGIGKDLMIASLNYAGECDEAQPDQDFIIGVMWERSRKRKDKKEIKNVK